MPHPSSSFLLLLLWGELFPPAIEIPTCRHGSFRLCAEIFPPVNKHRQDQLASRKWLRRTG